MTDLLQIMPYNINFDPTIRQHQVKSDWIPAAITAAAGLLGGLISSKSQARAQQRANEQNLQIARETNQANREISAGVNNMNWQIMRENNAYNRQLAFDMFNAENKYNDPRAQMARMKGAGINPFVAAGEIGNVEGRIDTLPSQTPPAATGIPAQMGAPVQPVNPLPSSFSAEMAGIAGAMAQLANARHQDAQTKETLTLLGDRMDNLQADTRNKEAQSHLANTNDYLQMMYGATTKKKEIQLLEKKIVEISKNMELTDAKIDESKSQRDLNYIDYLLKDAEHGIKHKEYEHWQEMRDAVLGEIRAAIKAHNSSARASDAAAANSYSQAHYNDVLADTQEQMQPYLVIGSKYEAMAKKAGAYKDFIQVVHDAKTLPERINQTNGLSEVQRATLAEMYQRIEQLAKQNKWADARELCNVIKTMTESIANVSRALTGNAADVIK